MQKYLILSRRLLRIYDVLCARVQLVELFPTLLDLFMLLATEEPNLEERQGRKEEGNVGEEEREEGNEGERERREGGCDRRNKEERGKCHES